MTKEKLEKEASNWLRKYLLCCNCEKKCNCIDSNSYCEEQVLKAYVDSAEPREKRIAELEKENLVLHEMNVKRLDLQKENAELKQINGRTLGQLNLTNGELIIENKKLKKENAELKEQIEKMKDKNKALELYADLADAKVDEVKSKLTKAKEIITALLNVFVYDMAEEGLDVGQIDVREKTEKFLKEASE